jgi:hypothetical protein
MAAGVARAVDGHTRPGVLWRRRSNHRVHRQRREGGDRLVGGVGAAAGVPRRRHLDVGVDGPFRIRRWGSLGRGHGRDGSE